MARYVSAAGFVELVAGTAPAIRDVLPVALNVNPFSRSSSIVHATGVLPLA
ncbi:MAG: hypothetical protein QM737_18075 [Ferruginibacter sp.]